MRDTIRLPNKDQKWLFEFCSANTQSSVVSDLSDDNMSMLREEFLQVTFTNT